MDSILNILISDSLNDLILNAVDNNQHECICSNGSKQISIVQVLAKQMACSRSLLVSASVSTHCKLIDLGNLSSGYLDRPMYANHTISLEYTLLRRGLFFNSEVQGIQYVRENRAEELN